MHVMGGLEATLPRAEAGAARAGNHEVRRQRPPAEARRHERGSKRQLAEAWR